MKEQSITIYFTGSDKGALTVGNFNLSVNKIDDYNMTILEAWTKRPSGICEFENVDGTRYRIFPSNIDYVQITKR